LPDDTVALLPVGATEQHGPHLPTATDTIIAEHMCTRAASTSGAIVLPPIAVGASFGHGQHLAGTLSLTPEGLADAVRNIVRWANRTTGIERFILVNAHMGNAAALSVATDHLRLADPHLRVAARDWVALDPDVARTMSEDAADWHANLGETAVMMAIAGHLVDELPRMTADDPDRTRGLVFRYTAASLSTNGVTGNPSLATPELGRWLVDTTVSALAQLVTAARIEQPPLTEHRLGPNCPTSTATPSPSAAAPRPR
jgi:creatinine amidohydrolase